MSTGFPNLIVISDDEQEKENVYFHVYHDNSTIKEGDLKYIGKFQSDFVYYVFQEI